MRVFKRASLAAAAALTLGAGVFVAAPAYAAPVSTVIGGITYEADGTNVAAGATATGFDGSTTTVTIPDTVEINGADYDVVGIGPSAFVTYSTPNHITTGDIASVVIGDNVTTIGLQAFMSNPIDSLTLGASVQWIRGSAFMGSSLTHVVIPASVTSIAGAAFAENYNLASVVFTGPAPSVRSADAGPSAVSFDTSGPDFMISFPEQYSADHVVDGYTTPEWRGYPAQATADDVPDSFVSITKTVDASFVRVHDWEFEKTGTVGEVSVGDANASADVDFTVTATPNGYTDDYHLLSGQITVTNEIVESMTVTVTDDPDTGVGASCAIVTSEGEPAGDLRLSPNESVILDYSCQFDGVPEDGTNTATVTWADVASASVTEDVVFTQRDTVFETITVGDDHANPDDGYTELGIATWNADQLPFTSSYRVTKENLPLGECTSVTNTAMIYEMERTAQATVDVCPEAAAVTPDPEVTPDAEVTPVADAPEPVALAQTGNDLGGGHIAFALLLMLAGGAAVLVTHRSRSRIPNTR